MSVRCKLNAQQGVVTYHHMIFFHQVAKNYCECEINGIEELLIIQFEVDFVGSMFDG